MQADPPANRFEFVIVASLRTAQLVRGCTPRVPKCSQFTATARREVQMGQISASPRDPLTGKTI